MPDREIKFKITPEWLRRKLAEAHDEPPVMGAGALAPPPSYHEKVARAMSVTFAAGSLNSYGTILRALVRTFPHEADLRRHVEHLESRTRAAGFAPDNWRFLADDTTPPVSGFPDKPAGAL